ncbi:MAG TPA: LAGLIDADG family homing endonuclease [Candidatus Nanoarchaeia archaeon]|nr:LAGLIDADG family homing endonuclease [Candidatus Nanoarchaeia archaeon]
MKLDINLAAIHGYLCSDGYVIKNPPSQPHRYYHIGLRNTNLVLLEDFQQKFKAAFGLRPIITDEGRCKIQNKEIYGTLTKDFSYYSYEWVLPKLSRCPLRYWLRAFFDCEGWVENQPAKSRLIGADCCNKKGLFGVQTALREFHIDSSVKKKNGRNIWRPTICGLQDLHAFQESIGFLHPQKSKKLGEAIASYPDYSWHIPEIKRDLLEFIAKKGKIRESRNEIRFLSIRKDNLAHLRKALKKHGIHSRIFGPWKSSTGSLYHCLIIKHKGVIHATDERKAKRHQANI